MTDSPSPAPASDVSREAVLAALATVNDPDIRRPLTELGMIDNLTVCGGNVRFEIKLTTTACPLKQKIREDAEAAVRVVPGVSAVHAEFSSKTVTLGAKPRRRPRSKEFAILSRFPAARAAWAKPPSL